MLRRILLKLEPLRLVDGRPFSSSFCGTVPEDSSHHGSESIGKTGAQQEHPLPKAPQVFTTAGVSTSSKVDAPGAPAAPKKAYVLRLACGLYLNRYNDNGVFAVADL